MASHVLHPSVHEHGLADDCPRCDELARRPLELGDAMIAASWRKMIAVEYGDDSDSYRSVNEAALGRRLYEVSLFVERYLRINPRNLWGRIDHIVRESGSGVPAA